MSDHSQASTTATYEKGAGTDQTYGQLDVIEPVDEPTEWCSPIVVVPKADGRVRICVDLTRLNQAVRREVYQMPTVEETLGSLTEGSVFSKLDANSGFQQIVLNAESAKLTTFITPFGRGQCSAAWTIF